MELGEPPEGPSRRRNEVEGAGGGRSGAAREASGQGRCRRTGPCERAEAEKAGRGDADGRAKAGWRGRPADRGGADDRDRAGRSGAGATGAAESMARVHRPALRSRELPGYDPCSDYPINAYLNDPSVQDTFHARMTEWSPYKNFKWKDAPVTMLPSIKFLIENKLPVWIFSGDFDSVCPLLATRYSIQDLGLPVTTPWRPWVAKGRWHDMFSSTPED
ncbi:putative serine carboxypeptidase-like 23 [Hordeum vulgare]|nr:putative serine carboxypeptidase-like 23 [Hordeum vulgare]